MTDENSWNEVGDEEEKKLAEEVYNAARQKVGNIEEAEKTFGDVHATVTIAFDDEGNFITMGNGVKDLRNVVQNTRWLNELILPQFGEFVTLLNILEDIVVDGDAE